MVPGERAAGRADRTNRGITLIEILIILAVLAILVSMAIPILASGRMAAREDTAIAHMRLLKTVMEQHRVDTGAFPPELIELLDAGYVSGFQVWGNDISRSGYLFHLEPGPDPAEWAIQANPITPGYTGDRFFRLDFLGEIRWNDAGPATDADPPMN
jgi:general secretion pathway protein G